MAVTFNDNGLTTLSKLKFGSMSYALKDAAGRAAINELDAKVATLNGDVGTEGSVLKLIKDNGKDATYDQTYTIATKIADIDARIQTLEGVTLDTEMSDTSTNGVQNKVIKAYVDAETQRATGVEQGLDTRLQTAEGAITTLNGEVSVDGSVRNLINQYAGDATFTFTGADSATTIKAAIQANADAIEAANKGQFRVIDELPAVPSEADLGIIYLVPDANVGYKEFVCINIGTEDEPEFKFEEIGDTHISLEGYATETWVTTNAKDGTYSEVDGVKTTIAQAIDANKTAISNEATAREQADNAITADIGTWTEEGRSDTVRAAIETLESQVTGTTVKSVNGVAASADNGGDIVINASQIKMSADEGAQSIPEAITAVDNKVDKEVTDRQAADTAITDDIGTWTSGNAFETGYTVKSAIEKNATDIATNTSAIAAIKANTANAITNLSGGTWEVDSVDPEMMVWTAISTSDATFLAGNS